MAALSWDEICKRASENNKTVICAVGIRGRNRFYNTKCNLCDIEKVQRVDTFSKCRGCSTIKQTKKTPLFIEQSRKIHGHRFDYGEVFYNGAHIKVPIRCNNCNTVFYQTPISHLRGKGCPNCAKNKKSNTEEFVIKANKLHYEKHGYHKYDYIGSFYEGCKRPLEIRCTDCNTVFYQTPDSHLSGCGCPNCNESRGELYLKKILRENNIAFIPQHIFPGLKYINPLKCDVYIPIVNLVIEVDGEGHREACFGSTPEEKQKNFEDTVRNDAIKDNYAKVNGINILRIPYSRSDKDLSFIGEISMNCYNDLLKVKNPVQLTLDL